jgi:mRNA interferase MazF
VSNPPPTVVRRGQLYWLDWSPARGSEQSGRRPALVVQQNAASANPNYPLTIVVAVSSKGRPIPAHVQLAPSERNGLTSVSFIKCEQIQTVSKDRFGELIGEIDAADIQRVETALKRVLAIS